MNVSELKSKKINELTQLAKKLDIEGYAGMRKDDGPPDSLSDR